ncbi:MAG: hypothetical protein KDA44_04195 [Planctomycetales bacterium]|nr:hypothetical protein [Planctomycetales bacterium]
MAVIAAAIGCSGSSSTAHLAGAVTVGGKPIPADANASITFHGSGEGQTVNVPIVDGKYDSPATPRGEVRVYFTVTQEVGPVKKSPRTGADYRDIVDIVPPKYATGVALTVAEDNQQQDFNLD